MSSYQLEVSSVAVLVPTIYSMMKKKRSSFLADSKHLAQQRWIETYDIFVKGANDSIPLQCSLWASHWWIHPMPSRQAHTSQHDLLVQQVSPSASTCIRQQRWTKQIIFAINYRFYSTHQTNLCCTRSSSACLLLPRAGWFSSFSFKPSRFNWCQRSSGDWSGELISIRPWSFS